MARIAFTFDLDDTREALIREAFKVQDQPATDAQLSAAVLDYLVSTTRRVMETEARAEATTRARSRVFDAPPTPRGR